MTEQKMAQMKIEGDTYFGLTFSLGMLLENSKIEATKVKVEDYKEAKEAIEAAISCINPSHKATIAVLESRFGISPEIPETAPIVSLKQGDTLFALQVSGLPRLGGDRKEYNEEEIKGANFTLWKLTLR